jgi:hypothetical protein
MLLWGLGLTWHAKLLNNRLKQQLGFHISGELLLSLILVENEQEAHPRYELAEAMSDARARFESMHP